MQLGISSFVDVFRRPTWIRRFIPVEVVAVATIFDWAKAYARRFGAVIPVGAWTYINKDGKTVDMWKSSLIPRWTTEPLRTEKEVEAEWRRWARWSKVPNIGLVTGQICGGYIVIDLDYKPEKGICGYEELKQWQQRAGMELPETWTAITGGGGYHLYFHTDTPMRGFVNDDCGVDLRADGNMALLPPSRHISGKSYQWEMFLPEIECAEADEAVFRFLDEYRPQKAEYRQSTYRGEGGERKMILPPEIPDGGRHNALLSMIGTMNKLGVSDEVIEYAVRKENQKCVPPLSEEELKAEVIPGIYRFEKGVKADEWKSPEEYRAQKITEGWQKHKAEQARKRLASHRQ